MASLANIFTSVQGNLIAGFIIRLGFLAFGVWQDSTMRVKYTDIDYHVFTDAARYVTEGESPYLRATYRYTPVLAWMLTPNILVHEAWGKMVFILCDIATGYLIYKLLLVQRASEKQAVLCAALWVLNPLPITVSSRGNAESLLSLLILASLYCLTSPHIGPSIMAYMLYGLVVHMKIYPITYALPLYLIYGNTTPRSSWKKKLYSFFWPNRRRIQLVAVSAGTFFLLTGLCYAIYGNEFLEETYFYHVTRRDTRHNFSVYFYILYLLEGSDHSFLLGLITFLPQASLLLIASFRYYDDLPFSCFINTFIFVTFNKVCTSQYFLWYLCLLPLVVPQIRMSVRRAVNLLAMWFVGQALWLLPAYYFEFEGQDTLLFVWLASILFFLINIIILHNIIQHYHPQTFPLHGYTDVKQKKLR